MYLNDLKLLKRVLESREINDSFKDCRARVRRALEGQPKSVTLEAAQKQVEKFRMSKFQANGKMNQNRAKLVDEIERLEKQQQQSLAKKSNGKKEDAGFSKLGDLREQLRKLA